MNEVTPNDKVYQLRRKNFQKKLVVQLCFLGYLVIVLHYVKYGCTIWTLVLRTVVQSLLTAPFPDEAQMRRLSLHRETPGTSYFSRLSQVVPANTVQMPGAFIETVSGQNDVNTQDSAKDEIKEVKRKISTVLFHGSATVNMLYILKSILFPVDFLGQLEGNYLHEDGLVNTPSPFNNGNGFIQGERKGSFFLQLIGESVPQSNIQGNLGILMFEFAILVCQFGLFVLTCVNFADLGYEEEPIGAHGDGYDGKVYVTQIDPNHAIDALLAPSDAVNTPDEIVSNMV